MSLGTLSALHVEFDKMLIKLDRVCDLGDGRFSVPFTKFDDVIGWCQDNNISAYEKHSVSKHQFYQQSFWEEITFLCDAQAVLFKLRWC